LRKTNKSGLPESISNSLFSDLSECAIDRFPRGQNPNNQERCRRIAELQQRGGTGLAVELEAVLLIHASF
jgi:hypothetical protein